MFRNWIIAFILPALMIFSGLLKIAPYKSKKMTINKKQQVRANAIYHKFLWQFGLAFAALSFMLMRSTRLLSDKMQLIVAFVWIVVEVMLLMFIYIPVERTYFETMTSVTEIAKAKVNLTLEVGQLRDDGFHHVRTIMTETDPYDVITIEKTNTKDIDIACAESDLIPKEDNLAYKAAKAFFDDLQLENPGILIKMTKNIPMQAGLGGGSSDAAAVIRALRTLFAPNTSDETLEAICAPLGADVPFFIRGGTLLCEGKGEKVICALSMPKAWYIIIKPEEAHPTGKMYGTIDALNPERKATADRIIEATKNHDLKTIAACLYNTFEDVLPEGSSIPQIKKDLLSNGAIGAMMCGSGSSVFGLFEEKNSAQQAFDVLKEKYPRIYLSESSKKTP